MNPIGTLHVHYGIVRTNPTAELDGNSNGWMYASALRAIWEYRARHLQVPLGSDLTNQQEGWAIDDMCFKKVAQ